MSVWKVDRSRVVARQQCPRKRFLAYDYSYPRYMGDYATPVEAESVGGLTKASRGQALEFGIAHHEGLSMLWQGHDIEAVVVHCRGVMEAAISKADYYRPVFFTTEQCFLLECMLRAWASHRLPSLLADYTLLETEAEREWEIGGGVTQMMRFDAVLEHKRQAGAIYGWDAKTVGTPSYQWQQQWEHDVQILSYTQAIEELYGRPCEGMLIEGMVKGRWMKDTAKSSPFFGEPIQQSPFCYGWMSKAGDLFTDYASGRTRTAIYNTFTAKAWVERLAGEGYLTNAFIVLPPICPPQDHRDRWKRQVVQAERGYEAGLKFVRSATSLEEMWERLDLIAPMHDNACFAYNRPCEFEGLCFHGQAEDPEAYGYQLRTPHHDGELKTHD